jgi:hypothetical protein
LIEAIENPLIWLSAFGAFMLNIASRTKGRQPISLFHVLNLNVAQGTGHPMAILVDMAISSILAGGLVFALTHPGSIPQAVVAGLGASSVLDAAGKDQV